MNNQVQQTSVLQEKLIGEDCKMQLTKVDGLTGVKVMLKATEADKQRAAKLPHIFTVEGEWDVLGELCYRYYDNAVHIFTSITERNAAVDYIYRNM